MADKKNAGRPDFRSGSGNNSKNTASGKNSGKNASGKNASGKGNPGKNNSGSSNAGKNSRGSSNAGKNNRGTNNTGKGNSGNSSRRSAPSGNTGSYEEPLIPITEEEADDIRVTVNMDDGVSVECMVLTIMEGPRHDYVALLPMDENDQPNAEGEVYLYRYTEDEQGIGDIENIPDDEEYEIAADLFDEWQDDQLFDEMDD